jgi:hypothetical protein
MLNSFYILWRSFFDICRFQMTPQQIPYSQPLLGLLLLAHALLSATMVALELPVAVALLSGCAETSLLAVLVFSLLQMAGYAKRAVQAISALAGTEIIIKIISLPALLWLRSLPQDGDAGGPLILLLGLMAWSMGISAHILRHALSTNFWIGLALSFTIALASLTVLEMLFPLSAG